MTNKKYYYLVVVLALLILGSIALYFIFNKSLENQSVKNIRVDSINYSSYTHPTGLFTMRYPSDWEVQSNATPIEQLKTAGITSVPVLVKFYPKTPSVGEGSGEQELSITLIIDMKGGFIDKNVDKNYTKEFLIDGYPSFSIRSIYSRERAKIGSAEYITRVPIDQDEKSNHSLVQTTYYISLGDPFNIDRRVAFVYLTAYTGEENFDFRKIVDEVISSIKIDSNRLPYVVKTLVDQLQ